LYWANYSNSTIGRALLDGTGVNQTYVVNTTAIPAATATPVGMAVDSTKLYFTNFDGMKIARTTIAGGTQGPTENYSYAYDDGARLTGFTGPVGSTTYTYDLAGNRTGANGATFVYDERNRLVSGAGLTYAWSPRGSLVSTTGTGGATYSFDGLDRMTGAGGVTYTYDSLDRVQLRSGAAAFTYAGLETDPVGEGTNLYRRSPSGSLLGLSRAGVSVLAGMERHGDLAFTLNPANGAITDTVVNDPFGKTLSVTGVKPSIGFQGDYTDPTNGLVWMAARWYSPGTGTFTTRDTYAGSVGAYGTLNRYTYGLNNPLRFTDPTGRNVTEIFGNAVGKAWEAAMRAGNTIEGAGNNVPLGFFGNKIFGNDNSVAGSNNTVVGNSNSVLGNVNTIVGDGNGVNGNSNTVIGQTNSVKGDRNKVIGFTNDVSGDGNWVGGGNNIVKGDANQVFGYWRGISGTGVGANKALDYKFWLNMGYDLAGASPLLPKSGFNTSNYESLSRIYDLYGKMFLAFPQIQWLGLAKIAGTQVLMQADLARLGSAFTLQGAGQVFVGGGQAIFENIFPSVLAFIVGGSPFVGSLSGAPDTYIDEMRGAYAQIEAGNNEKGLVEITAVEQGPVAQKYFDRLNTKAYRGLTTLSGGVPCIFQYLDGSCSDYQGNYFDFVGRMKWINANIIPGWSQVVQNNSSDLRRMMMTPSKQLKNYFRKRITDAELDQYAGRAIS
jgi:RHS repeat-associated protein